MAWKSIWGKKGRSALTILGIFIGIAAVMTIVSVMEGMKQETMKQFEAMGSNRITVSVYSWMYDEEGNDISRDYFPDLYDYCTGLSEYVLGITPTGWVDATVVYGTKSSANMEYSWDNNGNLTGDVPPTLYYGSDQYAVCNNLSIAKGRDLAMLDMEKYNQVCVMGAKAAGTFFGAADPVGKEIQVNGNNFTVVGVYYQKDGGTESSMDDMAEIPYSLDRAILETDYLTSFTVKVDTSDHMDSVMASLELFLADTISSTVGEYELENGNSAMTESTEEMTSMSVVLGGIIGILLGFGLSLVLGKAMYDLILLPGALVTAGAFGFSVIIGIVFGIYPAVKASNLQPVDALRAD